MEVTGKIKVLKAEQVVTQVKKKKRRVSSYDR
jgi:hypothetical protein